MTLEESIMYALEGNAILFLGAGFDAGVINHRDEEFPLGDQLCERLIKDGNIDVSEDGENDKKDLKYISERYLETNTRKDLLLFLKDEFICKSFTDSQKIIAEIDWKRIYTTNYDDTMEFASKEIGKRRETVDPKQSYSDVVLKKEAIIHLNGFVGNVNERDLDETFKLLGTSYRKRSIPNSDLAISLSNDIKNSKCLIFIGYSMDYDIELQQIFVESGVNKTKCIFISYNPSKRQRKNMENFGDVEAIGIEQFAKKLSEQALTYMPEKREYRLKCLEKIEPEKMEPSKSISDESVGNLFLKGEVKLENMLSVYSSSYAIKRTLCDEIAENISKDYQAIIIHSDMGNGKSILIRELELHLASRGKVYFLRDINSFIQDDMEYLSEERGIKYIFIENYNRIIDSEFVRVFANGVQDGIKFVFTVRTYLNENLYQRFISKFKMEEDKIAIYDINVLDENERNDMLALLNKYSLWGERATLNSAGKKKYINRQCNGEIKNVMLDLLNSPKMKGKVEELLEILFENQDTKEIILMSFICEVIACDLTLEDIILLLNKQARTARILKSEQIHEFIDFKNNRIKLKSSVMAGYVLQHMNYNEEVEEILKRILSVLDKNHYIRQYEHMLRMLISYSNLRMLFNRGEKGYTERITKIYELAKNLQYHKENPFFWLQYAIAKMEEQRYDMAAIFLDNAEAFRKKKYDVDSWQIDTNRGRLLLEKTVYEKNEREAFDNFDSAYHYLHDNRTPDMHYPLRQVSLFEKYYRTFYEGFSLEEKNIFLTHCIEIQKTLDQYLFSKNQRQRNNRELKRIKKMLEKMREEMVAQSD